MVKKAWAVCIFIMAMCSFAFKSYAAEPRTLVRVAYFDLADYYKTDEDGNMDSVDSRYLEAVSKYTDLDFKYVDCGTWENALKKLKKHEVDLIGTMQWTQEREDAYEISDTSYGYAVAELAARKDSGYIYEDYDGIDGATVGYVKGYVIGEQIKDLMREKNISFKIKEYNNQTALENALNHGYIDILAANSHAIRDNWTIVEKFHFAPVYFASWKGNEKVVDKISEALVKIKLYEPGFDDKLVEEYFGTMTNLPYNKQEIDLINRKQTYTVLLDTDTRPISWIDEDTGEMTGILVDVCKDIEKHTGLTFDYKPYTSKSENDTDIVSYHIVRTDDEAVYEDDSITDSIADLSFSLYHRTGYAFEADKAYSIVCVDNRNLMMNYLRKKYPKSKVTECENPEECLRLVKNGKADLAFVNTNMAESLIITESINNISSLPTTSMNFGIALEFHGNDGQLLAEIVNKGIQIMDDSVIEDSTLKYALATKPKTDLSYYIQNHPVIVIIMSICIIAFFILLSAVIMYARLMKNDKLRAESIAKERSDFFSRMSHDMRTPMNGILGLTGLSKDEKDIEVLQDNIRKIDESGQYLLGLINDTLDYQKIESGRMEISKDIVSTSTLIRTSVQMIQGMAEKKNVSFSVVNVNADTEGYIRTDIIRVRQLIVNLLSNAVKFTPGGGSVEMRIEVLSRTDKGVRDRITISDTGVGMSKAFIDNELFKPFAQEKNSAGLQYTGTGLGLSIAKQIAELLGATISVESRPGEGTRFTVEIEFETVDRKIAEKYVAEKERNQMSRFEILEGKNILLAEDHPINAEITQKLLERKGAHVTWVKNGKDCVDAVAAAKEGSIHAILMDIRMPVMDGLEAAKAIRLLDRKDAASIPIIAMSANAYSEDVQKSMAAGMNRHLAKPVQPEILYEALSLLLKCKSGIN